MTYTPILPLATATPAPACALPSRLPNGTPVAHFGKPGVIVGENATGADWGVTVDSPYSVTFTPSRRGFPRTDTITVGRDSITCA